MTPPGSRARLLFPVLSIGDPSGVQERVCFPVLSIGDPSGVQNAFAVPCASDRWPLRRPERVCFPVLAIGDPAGVRGEETVTGRSRHRRRGPRGKDETRKLVNWKPSWENVKLCIDGRH